MVMFERVGGLEAKVDCLVRYEYANQLSPGHRNAIANKEFDAIEQKIFFYPNETLACIAVNVYPNKHETKEIPVIQLKLERPSK